MKKITDVGIITQSADGKAFLTYIAKGGRADQYHGNGIGTNTDAFQLMTKYHFKGIEFGNWEKARKRNFDMEKAASELPELARIMHTLNLGMDNQIGLAFGARGFGGKAAAHYEPALNMINLTKTKGYGCLAHEYGHALDYNFGSFIDQHKEYAALSGGYSIARSLPDNTGCQFRALTNQIIDSICNGNNYRTMIKQGLSDYWFHRTEIFARFFEQYVAYKLHKSNSYAGILASNWNNYLDSSVYVAEADFMKVLPLMDKLVAEMGKCMNSKTTYKLQKTPYLLPIIVSPITKPIPMPKPNTDIEKAAAVKTRPSKDVAMLEGLPKSCINVPIYTMNAKVLAEQSGFSQKTLVALKACCIPNKKGLTPRYALRSIYFGGNLAVATNGYVVVVVCSKIKESKLIYLDIKTTATKHGFVAISETGQKENRNEERILNYAMVFENVTKNRPMKSVVKSKDIKQWIFTLQQAVKNEKGSDSDINGIVKVKIAGCLFDANMILKVLKVFEAIGHKKVDVELDPKDSNSSPKIYIHSSGIYATIMGLLMNK